MIQDIICQTEKITSPSGVPILRREYFFSSHSDTTTPDSTHRPIDEIRIYSFLQEITGTPADPKTFTSNYAFSRTGWQSWDAGWETMADERTPRYIPFLIPALKKYIEVPESLYKKDKEYGQFIIWLRWNNFYLVAASTGNTPDACTTDTTLPPVQYELCRKTDTITCRIYSTGKTWKSGDKTAEISFFLAKNYFELKETISFLFHDSRFKNLAFLGKTPGGWESWYNHYNKIDESLILEDLNALNTTGNLIKCMYIDKKQPVVFQIDDGWQEGTGQWEINKARFPHGFADLTAKIREKGYIPGLWIAPFIFDYRVPFIKRHPDWILRDKKGKPIPAGFNAPWGAPIGKEQPAGPHNYFVLDLSRDDVLQYLDGLIDRAINEWGFRYLKLDFLFAGMLYGCFKNGGAAYEWYNRAINVLTKRTKANNGEPVAYLGCGMPFESSFRQFPLSRIGADTKEAWDYAVLKAVRFNGRPSAYISMKDTLGHAYWNDAVYKNDPDVVFFRKENCTLTDSEKELLALVNKLFAGQIMYADDPAHFSPADEAPLTQKILALYDKLEGASFGNIRIAPDIYAIFSADCKYTGIINLTENEYTIAQGDLQKMAQLQAFGTVTPDAPHYKQIAGQGKIVETAAGFNLTVPSHSIYLQEKEI
ncbi:MAG: alpha-galactosidase [Spirochaetaceae bacterium]|nr:alpha-galactosidase [Spirochaetaceae bacterium]